MVGPVTATPRQYSNICFSERNEKKQAEGVRAAFFMFNRVCILLQISIMHRLKYNSLLSILTICLL